MTCSRAHTPRASARVTAEQLVRCQPGLRDWIEAGARVPFSGPGRVVFVIRAPERPGGRLRIVEVDEARLN